MKKILILLTICLLVLIFFVSCRQKVLRVPPPPPQVTEQPRVEKIEEPPAVVKPQLTEEEIFMSQSLDEVNRAGYLKMIHFDYDKYFIREDAKPALESNSSWLKRFGTAKILIEGHCDERGTEEYNLALGEKRSKSALDYLSSLGVAPERMRIISYGKSQPLDPGHDEVAWQKNRRAQFTIIEK